MDHDYQVGELVTSQAITLDLDDFTDLLAEAMRDADLELNATAAHYFHVLHDANPEAASLVFHVAWNATTPHQRNGLLIFAATNPNYTELLPE